MGRVSAGSLGDRPYFFPLVFLLVGAAAGPTELNPIILLALAAFTAIAGLLWSPKPGGHLLVLGAAALLGAGLSTLHAQVEVPVRTFAGVKTRLEGHLEEVVQAPTGLRGVLAVARVDGAPARFRARLAFQGPVAARAGQRVLLESRLRLLRPAANPGERDGLGAWERRGLVASGSAAGPAVVPLSPAPAAGAWLDGARAALDRTAARVAPDADAARLYAALAAGLRADLGPDLEDAFARSGLAHVLSVSGLHVAALALVALGLLRRLLVRVPWRLLRRVDARRVAAPLAVPLLWGYVAFTGNQGPAVRSALMASAWLLGLLLQRRSDAANALCLAALVLFAADPGALADLSLQLSVLSVLGLVVLAPALRAAVPVPLPSPSAARGLPLLVARTREALLGAACASAAAVASTAPLLAASFHRLGWAGLLSNVVCLPLNAAVSVAAALGAAAHTAAPSLAVPVVALGTWLAWLLVAAARLFAELPWASVPVAAAPAWVAAAWWTGLAAAALARGRARSLALLAPLAALAFAWMQVRPSSRGQLEVTFLAVGHGDAVYVGSAGTHLLIDGGGSPLGGDVGRRVVVPFLRERRVSVLDAAALTHPHPDHARGLAEVLRAVPARRLWLGRGAGQGPLVREVLTAAAGADVLRLQAGAAFTLGEAHVEVLGPPRDALLLESENDRSLVLKLTHGQVSFLLPGDVEEAGEEALAPGPVTVLKAPHHGSDTSSTPGFVAATRPRHVVFCVGADHRFAFPRAEVVERWTRAGARCHRTDVDGAVTFLSDGHDVRVRTFAPPAPRAARRAPPR